jgi:hypothetical protein
LAYQSFKFSFLSLFYKSYRQVLTSIDNLQRLLRLPIFNKTRLVTFHLKCNKETILAGFYQMEKSVSAHDLDSLLTITNKIIAKRLLQTDDAKHRHFNAVE